MIRPIIVLNEGLSREAGLFSIILFNGNLSRSDTKGSTTNRVFSGEFYGFVFPRPEESRVRLPGGK